MADTLTQTLAIVACLWLLYGMYLFTKHRQIRKGYKKEIYKDPRKNDSI